MDGYYNTVVYNTVVADSVRCTLWKFYLFIVLVICCLKSGVVFLVSEKCQQQTDTSFTLWWTRKIRSRNRNNRNAPTRSLIEKYTFYLIFKCVFVLISMLGWEKNSHCSSCFFLIDEVLCSTVWWTWNDVMYFGPCVRQDQYHLKMHLKIAKSLKKK